MDLVSDKLGKTLYVYRVEDVSLDNRARIVSTAQGKQWLAQFSVFEDGSVWLADSEQWETVKSPDTPKDDVKRPASSASSGVSLSDDTPEARVEAARQRRRLLSS